MLTILVEYLVAARKTGPGGVGAGQTPCVTRGGGAPARTRRPGCLAGAAGANAAGLRAWRGWQAWADVAAAGRLVGTGEGGRGGQAALLRCSENGDCSVTRAAAEDIPGCAAPWIRARHCCVKIGGAAELCLVSGQRF